MIDDAATSFHLDIQMGVTVDDGMFAIAATEHAEVRRSYLVENLMPFFTLEENLAVVLSLNHLRILVQQSLCHGEIGVLSYFAGNIATRIDVVVYLEFQGIMVVLWRVDYTIDDA